MSKNNKISLNFTHKLIIRLLVVVCICLIFLGCCFAKNKTKIIVDNSDVVFYQVGKLLNYPDNSSLTSSFSTVKLKDGTVLITGGLSQKGQKGIALPTDKTQILDIKNGKFIQGPDMINKRTNHSSILLPDGRVLVYGGSNRNSCALLSTEIFDPITKTFTIGPNLIENTIHRGLLGYIDNALFLDRMQEYLYIFTYYTLNLYDLKANKIYAFDPVRPHRYNLYKEYKNKLEGTDTIIDFENKSLETFLMNEMKKSPPFVYNDYKAIKQPGIVHYKDDLYYLFGGKLPPDYYNNVGKNISLYNSDTKNEEIIGTELSVFREKVNCLKLKNNNVLIWGKDINSRSNVYEIFNMQTQTIHTIAFSKSCLVNPVILDDNSILWFGNGYEKGKVFVLRFKEGVL